MRACFDFPILLDPLSVSRCLYELFVVFSLQAIVASIEIFSAFCMVSFNSPSSGSIKLMPLNFCEWEVIVQGDEGPVGGVAQVVCHGVIVVVGHQEEGQEEEGEKQGEVEGEVEKLKDNRASWMIWRWGERQVRTALSHVECDE